MSFGLSILNLYENQLLMYGETDSKMHILAFNPSTGAFIDDIKSLCDHCYCCTSNICRNPMDDDCVQETCARCRKIRSYNINTDEIRTVFNRKRIEALCLGPDNTVLGVEENGFMYQLE